MLERNIAIRNCQIDPLIFSEKHYIIFIEEGIPHTSQRDSLSRRMNMIATKERGKTGRPPKEVTRSEMMMILLTPEEKKKLIKVAEKLDMSFAAIFRRGMNIVIEQEATRDPV
jgi:hypothetical protein